MSEMDETFYAFRAEMRRKLGRIVFYPYKMDIFVADIIQIIRNNKGEFSDYLKHCTENEKMVWIKIIQFLKEKGGSKDIEKLIEDNLR